MLVMNSLDSDQDVVVGGNHFKFKARQIKEIYNVDIANTITTIKSEFGFVSLPDELTYIMHLRGTEEEKEKQIDPAHRATIEEARKGGVENYVRRLRGLVHNAQVSMRSDLEQHNIKADPLSYASKGDLHNMEELVKYQMKKEDEDQKQVNRLKELSKKLETQRG